MKQILAMILLGSFFCATLANEPTDAELLEMWTRQLRDQYQKDIQTESGRLKWHGKRLEVSINTNTLIKVSRYADGNVFIDKPKVITPNTLAEMAKKRIDKLPRRLVDARQKTENVKSAGISNVINTITINPQKGK